MQLVEIYKKKSVEQWKQKQLLATSVLVGAVRGLKQFLCTFFLLHSIVVQTEGHAKETLSLTPELLQLLLLQQSKGTETSPS